MSCLNCMYKTWFFMAIVHVQYGYFLLEGCFLLNKYHNGIVLIPSRGEIYNPHRDVQYACHICHTSHFSYFSVGFAMSRHFLSFELLLLFRLSNTVNQAYPILRLSWKSRRRSCSCRTTSFSVMWCPKSFVPCASFVIWDCWTGIKVL